MKQPIKQNGTAIFMALLIIAITAAIATSILKLQRVDIKRTQMMINSEEAYLYAQGVVNWGIVTLRDHTTPTDITWPKVLPPTDLADKKGYISGTLEQAESRININSLSASTSSTSSTSSTGKTEKSEKTSTDNDARTILYNLIRLLSSNQSEDDTQALLNAITAWTSPTHPSKPFGMDAYDNDYSRLNPPYRSPHTAMISTSELRTVSGMTSDLYEKLQPYVIALPTKTTLDTRFAAPLLLQAAGIAQQGASGSQEDAKKTSNIYYLLRANVYLQNQPFVLFALLERKQGSSNDAPVTVSVKWQSIGTI